MGETFIPYKSSVDSELLVRFKWDTQYVHVNKQALMSHEIFVFEWNIYCIGKILDGLRCLQGYEQKLRYLQEDSHNPDSGLASDCLSLVSTEENYELSDDKLLKLFIDTIDELIHLISDNDVIRLANLIDALREQIRCYQVRLHLGMGIGCQKIDYFFLN